MKTEYMQRTKICVFALMLFLVGIAGVNVIAMADPIKTELVAGRDGLTIGAVLVSNDGTNLIVEYIITLSDAANDWVINETHLAVNSSLNDIPQTRSGNPKPGHFKFKTEHDPGVKTVKFVIPLADLSADPGTELYLAAHAEVTNMAEPIYDSDGVFLGYREETAWGKGLDFPGRNWAMYFKYVVQ